MVREVKFVSSRDAETIIKATEKLLKITEVMLKECRNELGEAIFEVEATC